MRRRLASRLLLALALTVSSVPLALVLVTGHAGAQTTAPGITSVSAGDDTIVVTGRVEPGATDVAIYALGAEADPESYADAAPTVTATPDTDGAFVASIPRLDAEGWDRLYDQYVAVVGSGDTAELVGGPRFVDQLAFTPERDFDYPTALSKKGLQVEMTDDAEELGVQHAGINVPFNSLMRIGPGDDPAQVIPFESNGRTYYFDRNAVTQLDAQIKPLSDNGVLVNLILILYRDGNPQSAWPVLHHPDANLDAGIVFAFNTKTAEGVAYFTAAMEFLADRYTRADQKYGRAVGYIVGNEVDAQWVWANSGDMVLEDFLGYYAKAVRIAWLATQKYWNGARTYISLTHCWTTVCGANPDPANPTRFYPGKDVIDQLNALTKRTGDVGWNVAHHPYPEDLRNPAFWNDQTATPGFDTPRITFKNIEVLPAYLDQPDLHYGGASRRIILSEQGCNTPDASEEAERLQAACYAYAYYKIRFLDSIDAFILHRHVDHQQEGGLRLGLWTWDDERPESAMPGRHKVSYDVFEGIDTSRSLDVTEFAKPIIGIDDWADVIEGFDPSALAQRTPPRELATQVGPRPVRERIVSDFEKGTDGWRPADNAYAVEQAQGGVTGKRSLRVRFDSPAQLPAWSRIAKTWKGTDVVFDEPQDARRMRWLNLAVRVPEPASGELQPDNLFYARVNVYAEDGDVVYGLARLDPFRGWNRLSVDLSDWQSRSAIARVKVWVRGTTNDDWNGTFDLDHVSLSRQIAPPPGPHSLDASR
ncbi:MAG TPA: DUF5722 domain-containing protein [Actinopolymorphaceae bacterium]